MLRTQVGPHRVRMWLGTGGDAEVWAAEEAVTGARIAVKLMRADASRGRLGRLVREYQYLRMLDVRGVPRARGLGVDEEGRLFLVMDLIDGVAAGTWADQLVAQHKDDRAAALSRLLRMLARAARVLDEVHHAGLVHADIKPSAFLVGERDEVSLVDFGASRPLSETALTKKIAEGFGTAAYSAIEILHKHAPSIASDVWGMSAVAFRLLTGELPVGRGSRQELRERWPETTLDSLRERLRLAAPGLAPEAIDAIVRGFEPEPAARPSLDAWAEALASVGADAGQVAEAVAAARGAEAEPGAHTARLIALLRIAGEALSPRVLALAAGRSVRRTLATLEEAGAWIVRAGMLGWTLREPVAVLSGLDGEAAAALAEALGDEPVSAARIRALVVAGRLEDALTALERWLATLEASGRLAEALPLSRVLPAMPSALAPRYLLARARLALAAPGPEVALDEALAAIAERDRLLGPPLARARWALARHFGTYHCESRPAALAIGWRAYALGELDAALTSAGTALDEARWLGLREAEADARGLLALVLGARGELAQASRHAAEAIDRLAARGPGIGEAVATLARLRFQAGAWSEARQLVAARAGEAPTTIDRVHLLIVLAEIELALEHLAVVHDALGQAEALTAGAHALPVAVESRLMALRLKCPGGRALAERAEDAEARLRALAESGLASGVPVLAAALAEAWVELGALERAHEALRLAEEAAEFMADLQGKLTAARARATLDRVEDGEPAEVEAIASRARTAGLWTGLMELALAAGDEGAAWSAAGRILPQLDLADANALSLLPWAVRARERS